MSIATHETSAKQIVTKILGLPFFTPTFYPTVMLMEMEASHGDYKSFCDSCKVTEVKIGILEGLMGMAVGDPMNGHC